ncbi:membrane-spanning 4-domains subfamily A member 4A isoform X1 [Paralichthys olivaceus]|uniref:membrane-spanning 4-domains subfamily A member 4A isoform X1 n=1 Tax=Paralichthys olivaceus TaxID=8255 RepID=UPI0037531650
MKNTFVCNESMIISIPIGNLKDAGAVHLMPEKFSCVFKDSYKVFVINGKPKPLGAAQAIAGVFLCTLGLIVSEVMPYTLPCVLFVVSGLLSYAAGKSPHMQVAKLSLSLNIISFFWSIAAIALSVFFIILSNDHQHHTTTVFRGVSGLIMGLLVVECFLALFLIYWLSKAVCRQHFNTLPIILLKHGD